MKGVPCHASKETLLRDWKTKTNFCPENFLISPLNDNCVSLSLTVLRLLCFIITWIHGSLKMKFGNEDLWWRHAAAKSWLRNFTWKASIFQFWNIVYVDCWFTKKSNIFLIATLFFKNFFHHWQNNVSIRAAIIIWQWIFSCFNFVSTKIPTLVCLHFYRFYVGWNC